MSDTEIRALAERMAQEHDVHVGRAEKAIRSLVEKGLIEIKPQSPERYGCHVELFAMPEGTEPDGCVIDEGRRHDCIYARDVERKELCEYWQRVTPQSIAKAKGIA